MKHYFSSDVVFENVRGHVNDWTQGRAIINKNMYFFEIKHFEEPSEFGIQNGRISKLHITEFRYIKGYEISYDRGWCHHWRKAPKEMQAVYRAILKKYN
jgi:hypothetical protein